MNREDLDCIKLIILDVDGTMTDGGVYIDNNGIESKRFSIKDGAGILLAEQMGIEFMILTGRESICVAKRAKELKIEKIYQGISKKYEFIKEYMGKNDLKQEEIAYIGDDLNDLAAMKCCGISACPSDAADEVKEYCPLVLEHRGGEGVVREFVEILLKQRKQWDRAIQVLFGN